MLKLRLFPPHLMLNTLTATATVQAIKSQRNHEGTILIEYFDGAQVGVIECTGDEQTLAALGALSSEADVGKKVTCLITPTTDPNSLAVVTEVKVN